MASAGKSKSDNGAFLSEETASAGKSKSDNDGRDVVKRRKVGFAADNTPCDANDCLKLHLVLPEYESETFVPDFSERIFEDGKIYGYKGLRIDLWWHAASFNAYVEIRYDSKTTGGKKPVTNVLGKLKEVFGDNLTEDRDSFFSNLQSYSTAFEQMLTNHGEVLFTSEENLDSENEKGTDANLKQIVRVELKDAAALAWHSCLTALCLLFIEGAQPIEADDPQWEVYLALEGKGCHTKVVGFCNVYRFYRYPDSTRLRVSQILVLPPFQGKGFGLHLLEIVNTTATQRNCYDVTMEEPSVALQKLRDTMDVLHLLSMPSCNAAIKEVLEKLNSKKVSVASKNPADNSVGQVGLHGPHGHSSSQISQGVEKSVLLPPAHLVELVRNKFKISKRQFKRCWEQLLYIYLDPSDRDLHDVFQEGVVQRLSSEIFEKDNNSGLTKEVVDTENEFDSSKTFVMFSRKIKVDTGNGSSFPLLQQLCGSGKDAESSALITDPDDKEKVLQEELQERREELLAVAQVVSRHCKPLGLKIPLFQTWDEGLVLLTDP